MAIGYASVIFAVVEAATFKKLLKVHLFNTLLN